MRLASCSVHQRVKCLVMQISCVSSLCGPEDGGQHIIRVAVGLRLGTSRFPRGQCRTILPHEACRFQPGRNMGRCQPSLDDMSLIAA